LLSSSTRWRLEDEDSRDKQHKQTHTHRRATHAHQPNFVSSAAMSAARPHSHTDLDSAASRSSLSSIIPRSFSFLLRSQFHPDHTQTHIHTVSEMQRCEKHQGAGLASGRSLVPACFEFEFDVIPTHTALAPSHSTPARCVFRVARDRELDCDRDQSPPLVHAEGGDWRRKVGASC
jgi:hypothetical protein